jgi:hypothetical protein
MKVVRTVVLFTAILAAASLASANTVPADSIEAFRGELSSFAADLEAFPDLKEEGALFRETVASMPPEQLEAMELGLQNLPHWRELPVMLASLAQAEEDLQRMRIARLIGDSGFEPPTAERELEYFRQDFIFLLDRIAVFAPMLGEEQAGQIEHLRGKVETMPADGLMALRDEFVSRSGEMLGRIDSALGSDLGRAGIPSLLGPDGGFVSGHAGCGSCCGDVVTCVGCWTSLVGCLIDEVGNLVNDINNFFTNFFTHTIPGLFTKIAELPGKVLEKLTAVFNSIASFVTDKLNALIALIPDSLDDVLAYLGIDWNNINWSTIAGSIPTIGPPCSQIQQAVDIAADVCDRGGDALSGLLFELMPDDGLSFAFKAGVAVIHLPLTFLCQCADIQEAIAYADDQAAHRLLTSTNLDLKLSTRATQSSVNALSLSLLDLDNDVAKVEGKLDVIQNTVDRIETNIDRTEATSDRMHTKVDALTAGNSGQQEWLGDFRTMMTRLNIERNLLQQKPNAISLFQLPTAFDGLLDTVAMIAADTIQLNLDASQTIFGAERELQRGDQLRLAGDFAKAYEAYRSAYFEAVK